MSDRTDFTLQVREIALREAVKRANETPGASVIELAKTFELYLLGDLR